MFGIGQMGLRKRGGGGGGVPRNNLFGVKISGPQYAPWNGQKYPTNADFAYLASKGNGLVRLPIAWESIQPALNAALDATTLASVIAAIGFAKANGMNTVVEVCNFGGYIAQAKWIASDGVVAGYAGNAGVAATGVSFLGDGTLTIAAFTDLLTRLATALQGLSGYIGIAPMNEPSDNIAKTNLIFPPNYFGASPGINSWGVTNACVATQQAAGSNPLGATYSPSWTITSGSGFGSVTGPVATFAAVLQAETIYAKCAAGTEALNMRINNLSSGNRTVTTTWRRFVFAGTPTAGSGNLQFQNNAASGHTIEIANSQLEFNPATSTSSTIVGSLLTVAGTIAGTFAVGQEIAVANVVGSKIISLGTGTGGAGTYNLDVSPGDVVGVAIIAVSPYAPNFYLPFAQAAVTAIRAVDATIPIYLSGVHSYSAPAWPQFNDEMAQVTGGNVIFEAHQYFDGPQGVGGGGIYSGSYASYSITSTTGSVAVAPFIAWGVTRAATINIGEYGIPAGADATSWLAVQAGFVAALRAGGCKSTVWNSAATSSPSDQLNVTAVANDARLLQIMAA